MPLSHMSFVFVVRVENKIHIVNTVMQSKNQNYFSNGGWGWGEGLIGSLTMVTHILVNPITWYLRRLKLCERLEYATITLHIISYTPNRVVVEDTVFFRAI